MRQLQMNYVYLHKYRIHSQISDTVRSPYCNHDCTVYTSTHWLFWPYLLLVVVTVSHNVRHSFLEYWWAASKRIPHHFTLCRTEPSLVHLHVIRYIIFTSWLVVLSYINIRSTSYSIWTMAYKLCFSRWKEVEQNMYSKARAYRRRISFKF